MDMRDFIDRCAEVNELKRIKAEVDWNLEISHVSKLNEEKGGPALLFENVTGYKSPVLTGAFGTVKRLNVALGMPLHYSMCDMARQWMKLSLKEVIPAEELKTGPVMENVIEGNNVDISKFPVPKFYELDAGRYIGTAVFVIVRDPESGEINLGTYRMQMHDGQHCGVQMLPGKRGERILRKYAKMKKPMPAAAVIGCDPILFMVGTMMHSKASEFDIAGSLRGEPAQIINSDLTGLPIPASAEIVLEGFIDPEGFRAEGPFGEYTGYYSDEFGKEIRKPCLEIKRVLHRNNPILWATSVGRPVTDAHMLLTVTRTATLWTELETMKIPGIKSVYIPPETAGRFWVIVSVKQLYPGHSSQVAAAVLATNTGGYGTKGVIIVDDDIDADDLPRVWWALGVRYDPMRGTELIKRGRSTVLDPALDPDSNRMINSRIIMDATIPYDWKEKPIEIKLSEDVLQKVRSRWQEYGF